MKHKKTALISTDTTAETTTEATTESIVISESQTETRHIHSFYYDLTVDGIKDRITLLVDVPIEKNIKDYVPVTTLLKSW